MAPEDAAPPPGAAHLIVPVWFTGSGKEYFRIWAVDALLTVVTLSLYAPFARARRLRYFYANTVVGYDPLGFHGNPWTMLRWHLAIVVFTFTIWAAFRLGTSLAWQSLALVVLVVPAFWHAALRYRLDHTGWRGTRLSFHGSRIGAYLSLMPTTVPMFAVLVMWPRWSQSAPGQGMVASLLVMAAALPWTLFLAARYVQSGLGFARQRAELHLKPWVFYQLSFKVFWLALPCVWLLTTPTPVRVGVACAWLMWVVLPSIACWRQNLLWSHTRSQRLRFRSHLRWGALCRLQASNAIRILLTLGLYWPYARVRTARLRLESISVQIEGDADQWQSRLRATGQGVLGEDSVDFLGIDVGD